MDYAHWPEAKVVRRIWLGPLHQPTGHIIHRVSDEQGTRVLPPPAEILIARHDSFYRKSLHGDLIPTTHFYIFYLDANGEEMTDDCESTLEDALWLVERGFQIKPDEWEKVD